MRLLLQRVKSASVRVAGDVVGRIDRGALVLVGVEKGDDSTQVDKAVRKLPHVRMFDDSEGRMNLDATQIGGGFLVVSQFTLAGSLVKGRRPSFDRAAAPENAAALVEELIAKLRQQGLEVASGRFRARMEVELINDGPVTFVLDL